MYIYIYIYTYTLVLVVEPQVVDQKYKPPVVDQKNLKLVSRNHFLQGVDQKNSTSYINLLHVTPIIVEV